MHAVQNRGFEGLDLGIAGEESPLFSRSVPEPGSGVPFSREKSQLSDGIGVALDPVGGSAGAIFAEQVPGPICHRKETYDAFFLGDDVAGPGLKVDPHGLGETPDDIKGECKPFGRGLGD